MFLPFFLTFQKPSLLSPFHYFPPTPPCSSSTSAFWLDEPQFVKSNSWSPTSLCLCGWRKTQNRVEGFSGALPYCLPHSPSSLFSSKPSNLFLILPFRPCLLFHWKQTFNRRNQQRLITASLPSHPVPIYSASWYGQIAFKSHPSMRHYLSRVLLQHVSPFPSRTSTVFLSTGSSWAAYWLSLKIKTVGLHLSL